MDHADHNQLHSGHLEVRRSTTDTFTELRQLADDLTEPGDNATAALVRKAIDKFCAWKFEARDELLRKWEA